MLDVVIGTDTQTCVPVSIPNETRDTGVALVGMQGTGKSTVLERLIMADLEHGVPGFVIDPHGTLVQRIIELATPEQAERIILLEADETASFGLNLLAVRDPVDEEDKPVSWVLDNLVAVFKKLYGGESTYQPRLERYLRLCARTLILSGQTLDRALDLFDDQAFLHDCLAHISDPHEQRRLSTRWANFAKLRPADQRLETEALINRFESLLDSEIIKKIVGSKESTVPFDQVLNGDRMLLVSLPSEQMTDERCDFIGILLLIALADRIFTRKARIATPPRLHVYIDEVQRFATSTTAKLLEQGRKYGTGLTLAHQNLAQISESQISDASTKSGTLIVLRVSKADADILAGNFPIEPKPEWVETIEEVDGTEPKLMPSPTPAEDIYIEGHSDPDVDLAARSFFRPMSGSPSHPIDTTPTLRDQDGRLIVGPVNLGPGHIPKSEGISARSGGIRVPWEVQMPPYGVNHLLYKAMTSPSSASAQAFVETLQEDYLWCLYLDEESYEKLSFAKTVLYQWLMQQIRDGKKPLSVAHVTSKNFSYIPFSPTFIVNADIVRQRVRWLWILWVGLQNKPVLISSGEQQPRWMKRHIVHSGHAYADAINEFANRLVNPPGKFVAQVKLSVRDKKRHIEYHETQLLPQLTGRAGVHQVALVRRRSQALYRVAGAENAQPSVAATSPPAEGTADSGRTLDITRRPGGSTQEPQTGDSPAVLPIAKPLTSADPVPAAVAEPVVVEEEVPPENELVVVAAELVEPVGESSETDIQLSEVPASRPTDLAEPIPSLEQHEAAAVPAEPETDPDLLWWEEYVEETLEAAELKDGSTQLISYSETELIFQTGSPLLHVQHGYTRGSGRDVHVWHRSSVPSTDGIGLIAWTAWVETPRCPSLPEEGPQQATVAVGGEPAHRQERVAAAPAQEKLSDLHEAVEAPSVVPEVYKRSHNSALQKRGLGLEDKISQADRSWLLEHYIPKEFFTHVWLLQENHEKALHLVRSARQAEQIGSSIRNALAEVLDVYGYDRALRVGKERGTQPSKDILKYACDRWDVNLELKPPSYNRKVHGRCFPNFSFLDDRIDVPLSVLDVPAQIFRTNRPDQCIVVTFTFIDYTPYKWPSVLYAIYGRLIPNAMAGYSPWYVEIVRW